MDRLWSWKPLAQDGNGVAEAGKGGDFGGVGADGKAIKVDLSKLNLSRAPYAAPVPWGTQWYRPVVGRWVEVSRGGGRGCVGK